MNSTNLPNANKITPDKKTQCSNSQDTSNSNSKRLLNFFEGYSDNNGIESVLIPETITPAQITNPYSKPLYIERTLPPYDYRELPFPSYNHDNNKMQYDKHNHIQLDGFDFVYLTKALKLRKSMTDKVVMYPSALQMFECNNCTMRLPVHYKTFHAMTCDMRSNTGWAILDFIIDLLRKHTDKHNFNGYQEDTFYMDCEFLTEINQGMPPNYVYNIVQDLIELDYVFIMRPQGQHSKNSLFFNYVRHRNETFYDPDHKP